MPELTLSLPVVLGLMIVFLAVGAGLVYYAMRPSEQLAVAPTASPTVTMTLEPTFTPTPFTPTPTDTPAPTATPQSYVVQAGDTCSTIAFAFGISIPSIVLMNDLPAACDTLIAGQRLLIPQPTPTVTPQPTATMNAAEATRAACGEVEYTIQDNDTLSSIAANYNILIAALKEYNGLVSDTVRSGQQINIPLCERVATPGPSPTPTLPPPYPAPNLLLPPDGAPFTSSGETPSLQWAAVGTLRENERYAVTILDVTEGQDRRLVDYVLDTKYIVPFEFLPGDGSPHIVRWWVLTARQVGTDAEGNPIWEPAGASSQPRDFIWTNTGAPPPVSTPTP